VREVLRLTTAGVGLNEIARRVGVAPSTVRLTLKRLARAGLSWPLPGEMTDTAILFAQMPLPSRSFRRVWSQAARCAPYVSTLRGRPRAIDQTAPVSRASNIRYVDITR
jgi:hypothetical protein